MHFSSAYNKIVTSLPQEVQLGLAELRSLAQTEYLSNNVDPATFGIDLSEEEHNEEKFEEYTLAKEKAVGKFSKSWGIPKIEEYLMRNYRPPLSRDDIKNSLSAIRMRRNENPSVVVERLFYGVKMARESITLMNKTGAANNELMKYSTSDRQDLFIRCFVTENYIENDNDGQINKKMQQEVARKQPQTMDDWKAVARTVMEKVQSPFSVTRKDYQIEHHPVIPLPIWETPKPIANHINRFNTNTPRTKKRRYRDHTGHKGQNGQRASKKQRLNQRSTDVGNCYRCGKPAHRANQCYSKYNIDGEAILDGAPYKYSKGTASTNPKGRWRSRGRGRGYRGNSRGRGSFRGRGRGNSGYRGKGSFRGRGRGAVRGRGVGNGWNNSGNKWTPKNDEHSQSHSAYESTTREQKQFAAFKSAMAGNQHFTPLQQKQAMKYFAHAMEQAKQCG